MPQVTIAVIGADASERDIHTLASILLDAIDANAGVSFMPGLSFDQAVRWWRSVLCEATPPPIVLVARLDDRIVGTVQLQPAWAPNQPHRADVAKLIVHRDARRQGIGRALMHALEREAAARRFTLLLLDTRLGDYAERLYTSMGWTRAGEVPDYALNPDGTLCTTVFFYKHLS